MVSVMDGEVMHGFGGKAAPAARADPGVKAQRLLTVTLKPLIVLVAGLGYDFVKLFLVKGPAHGSRRPEKCRCHTPSLELNISITIADGSG